MLSSLKAAIESKKRTLNVRSKATESIKSGSEVKQQNRDSGTPGQAFIRQPAQPTSPNAEEDQAIHALQEKAKRYRQLEAGESNLVPKGALIDFEQKLRRPVVHEDGNIEDAQDKHSRSRAAVPHPQSDRSTREDASIGRAVDDILNTLEPYHDD